VLRRSPHALPLIVIGLVVGGITAAIALLIDWVPAANATQADRTDTLLWFAFTASAAIFVIVVTALTYSIWKFRAAPGDESDGPPNHGHTALEIFWTAIPAALLVILSVYSAIVLSRNEAHASDRLRVNVVAQQFVWSFAYGDAGIQTGDLRVPVGRQVELKMTAKDVIHDFWVNEFRLKEDLVPGVVTDLVFTPDKVGVFPVICAELCGVGHNTMRSRIIVLPPDRFQAWLTAASAKVRG
jgi:cytochrome c oxidase subunit 2